MGTKKRMFQYYEVRRKPKTQEEPAENTNFCFNTTKLDVNAFISFCLASKLNGFQYYEVRRKQDFVLVKKAFFEEVSILRS